MLTLFYFTYIISSFGIAYTFMIVIKIPNRFYFEMILNWKENGVGKHFITVTIVCKTKCNCVYYNFSQTKHLLVKNFKLYIELYVIVCSIYRTNRTIHNSFDGLLALKLTTPPIRKVISDILSSHAISKINQMSIIMYFDIAPWCNITYFKIPISNLNLFHTHHNASSCLCYIK